MRVFGIMSGVALIAIAVVTGAMAVNGGETKVAAPMQDHAAVARTQDREANLRVTLGRLLGEHAKLAINATRKGYDGDRDFQAAGAALDRNSVELANAIGSVYGRKARNEFLSGPFKWRAHIRFFVAYTVALKRKDAAGQRKAVNDLKGYIGSFSGFLAQATDLPPNAVRKSINEHVMQLKGQIDAYSRNRFARAYALERAAYKHMFMLGNTLAAAIAKQNS